MWGVIIVDGRDFGFLEENHKGQRESRRVSDPIFDFLDSGLGKTLKAHGARVLLVSSSR